MNDLAPVFTVFTATYNRAEFLPRVWNSLRRQTFREFEWLVVDDGSTDRTRELVEGWQQSADFPVRYAWQPNGHKKKAFNHGVRLARGQFFLPLDSDDECEPQALERFLFHWQQIPEAERSCFAAVTVLCKDAAGRPASKPFPCPAGRSWMDSDFLEMRYRWRVVGERWGFNRIEVLREFPFPEDVVGLVPEGVVWGRIARHYKTRYVNEALRTYHQDHSGRAAQVTRGDPRDSAPGLIRWMRDILEAEISWFPQRPLWFCRCAANFTRFALLAGLRPLAECSKIDNLPARALVRMMSPVGAVFWVVDNGRRWARLHP